VSFEKSKKYMILFINTTDLENISLALLNGERVTETKTRVTYNENDKTLTLLNMFLIKNKVTLENISEIWVCTGPGSFTGVRVGVTLAKAFGQAKNIPIFGIKKENVPQDLQALRNAPRNERVVVEYNRDPF